MDGLNSRQILAQIFKRVQKLLCSNIVGATNTMPSQNVLLRFAKISQNAYTPTKGSEKAAGFDLYSAYDYTVPAQGKVVALTDIQIAVPDGCYGRVAPRSGLAAKHFIDVGAGVIDQDYRGNVGVVLFNFSKVDFEIKKGDRIAQLILEQIFMPELKECKVGCTVKSNSYISIIIDGATDSSVKENEAIICRCLQDGETIQQISWALGT